MPIVDAGIRQLLAEGFMHNRARTLTASVLVKEFGIDWRVGARHFLNRRSNLTRRARCHDPDGTYVRRYVLELADVAGAAVHEPWLLPAARRARLEYPEPIGGVPSIGVPGIGAPGIGAPGMG